MKNYPKIPKIALLLWAAARFSTIASAQSGEARPAEETPPAATQDAAQVVSTPHLKLCAQLGLKPGWTYEFMIAGNDEVHYWTIRSLGEKGWILVKDSRYSGTWLNLSRVIAVTPVNFGLVAERPKKPNRTK